MRETSSWHVMEEDSICYVHTCISSLAVSSAHLQLWARDMTKQEKETTLVVVSTEQTTAMNMFTQPIKLFGFESRRLWNRNKWRMGHIQFACNCVSRRSADLRKRIEEAC
jgi:hypothetical protein